MKTFKLVVLLMLASQSVCAQDDWFTLYTDATALATDGNTLSNSFINDIKQIQPDIVFDVKTIHNTTPYLIYYNGDNKTANLPLWSEVIPEQQQFFYQVAGGEAQGKAVFGLFFNGFYLPHELGHALQDVTEGDLKGSYDNEYFANTVAILWLKKIGKTKQLDACYTSAKTMWGQLPNPVPEGMTLQGFFDENYYKAAENPFVYGYMQFKQFISIYEDASLTDFDTFIKNYLETH